MGAARRGGPGARAIARRGTLRCAHDRGAASGARSLDRAAPIARARGAAPARAALHRPELGTTRAHFEAQTTEDFWESGASGRRYGRAYVLAMLEDRWSRPHEDPWETSEFQCREAGEGTYVLTYTVRQGERVTRRLTIWRKVGAQWKAMFHQGTLVTG